MTLYFTAAEQLRYCEQRVLFTVVANGRGRTRGFRMGRSPAPQQFQLWFLHLNALSCLLARSVKLQIALCFILKVPRIEDFASHIPKILLGEGPWTPLTDRLWGSEQASPACDPLSAQSWSRPCMVLPICHQSNCKSVPRDDQILWPQQWAFPIWGRGR